MPRAALPLVLLPLLTACPPQLTTPLVTLPTAPGHLGAPVGRGHVEVSGSADTQLMPHVGPAADHPLERVGVMIPSRQYELSLRWGISDRTELGLRLSRTAGRLTPSGPDVRGIPDPGHSGAALLTGRCDVVADGPLRWSVGAHLGPTFMEVHHWNCEVECENEAQCLEACGDFDAYVPESYGGAIAWVYGGRVAAHWAPLDGVTFSPFLSMQGHPYNVPDHLDPEPEPAEADEDESVSWAVDHVALTPVVTYGFDLERRWDRYRVGATLYHPIAVDGTLPLGPILAVRAGTTVW